MKIIKLKPFQETAIDAVLTQFENADGSTVRCRKKNL